MDKRVVPVEKWRRDNCRMITKLTGLIAAPFTPMQVDGSLNLDLIEQQATLLAANGVQGAFVCGTTGEGLSLTTQERMQVAERWLAVAPKGLRVIVHVGHNSVGESRRLAAHAQQIGAHAIASIGSTFFRPPSAAELVDLCALVAAAAPALLFYYYHLPAMTGVNLPMTEFLRLGAERIPTLAGMKFTDENLMSYAQCLNFDGGRFNILFGRDEILLAALALGATGAVGSTFNYMAPIYLKVIEAFRAGDLDTARHWQMLSIRIIAVMVRYGGLPAGKAIMKMIGVDCGPVRPPLRNLTVEEYAAFQADLAGVGFPAQVPKTISNHERSAWATVE